MYIRNHASIRDSGYRQHYLEYKQNVKISSKFQVMQWWAEAGSPMGCGIDTHKNINSFPTAKLTKAINCLSFSASEQWLRLKHMVMQM